MYIYAVLYMHNRYAKVTIANIGKEATDMTTKRGPGRPPVGPAINIRLSPALLEQVDTNAEALGETRAEAIRRLLAVALRGADDDSPNLEQYATTYRVGDAEHAALQLPWAVVSELLGRDHRGERDDDRDLVTALLEAGGPFWVRNAPGWIDESGLGLVGPMVADFSEVARFFKQHSAAAGAADARAEGMAGSPTATNGSEALGTSGESAGDAQKR